MQFLTAIKTSLFQKIDQDSKAVKLIAIIFVLLFSILIAVLIPDYAADFSCFYQAGAAVLSGQSPYVVPGFYSPVWVALLFVPFAFFSRAAAYRIYAVLLFSGTIYLFWTFSKHRFWITLIACCSPFIFMTMQYGNVDWLALFGLIAPAPIAVWFLLIKPQMGFILVLLLAWETYRQRGLRKLLLIFTPAALGLGLSYLLGMRIPNPAGMSGWSADVWPLGLMVGLPALAFAFKNRDERLALAAAPFLTPYIGPMSWVAILPKSMQNYRNIAIACVFSWVLVFAWRSHIF